MKSRMTRMVLAFAAVFAATVTLTTTSALASTPAPAAAQPATSCPWFSPPIGSNITYLGTIICEYQPLPTVGLPNNTLETFAVGTSHAVWTAWSNTSGSWDTASLGGLGYSAPWIVAHNGWGLTLGVSSASGGHYCDNRADSPSGGWTGWFAC
jgi:hypothetical protein